MYDTCKELGQQLSARRVRYMERRRRNCQKLEDGHLDRQRLVLQAFCWLCTHEIRSCQIRQPERRCCSEWWSIADDQTIFLRSSDLYKYRINDKITASYVRQTSKVRIDLVRQ